MKFIPITSEFDASITQMRDGAAYGASADELEDGNMIPRLCRFAGEGACAQVCQLKLNDLEDITGKLCATENILTALEEASIKPENFAMIAATKDRIVFADNMDEMGANQHLDGYTLVPDCNAFFFRPGKDETHKQHSKLNNVAMRMADCGDVIYSFPDSEGEDVIGIAHFSRTNMRGPSAYLHELDGKKVSWGEQVLGTAIMHYGVDPSQVKVKLVAAVEGKNFIHHYSDEVTMDAHFPGWKEVGFMHPKGDKDFDCLIDYREMIEWQLTDSVQDSAHKILRSQVEVGQAIDTGDLSLGHSSHHHAATHGEIAHGRDMYIVGLNKKANIATLTT